MQTYSEKAIALVLDLYQPKNIAQGIEHFVDLFRFLEQDDTAYLFNQNKEVFNKRGRAVACLSQYKFRKQDLSFLVRDALDILAAQAVFFHKVLYIVSDSIPNLAEVKRVKNVVAKNGIKTLFFEVSSQRYLDFFENHVVVENLQQAKEIIQTDYRKDVIVE